MRLTNATDVNTSVKIITIRTIKKLFRSLWSKLKANMKSSKVRQRNTRLSMIVMVRIRTSSPTKDSAIVDLTLIEWVTAVSSWLPNLSTLTPKTRKDAPVIVCTNFMNLTLSPFYFISLKAKNENIKTHWWFKTYIEWRIWSRDNIGLHLQGWTGFLLNLLSYRSRSMTQLVDCIDRFHYKNLLRPMGLARNLIHRVYYSNLQIWDVD